MAECSGSCCCRPEHGAGRPDLQIVERWGTRQTSGRWYTLCPGRLPIRCRTMSRERATVLVAREIRHGKVAIVLATRRQGALRRCERPSASVSWDIVRSILPRRRSTQAVAQDMHGASRHHAAPPAGGMENVLEGGGAVPLVAIQTIRSPQRITLHDAYNVSTHNRGTQPFDDWRRTDVAPNHAAPTWAEGVRRLVEEDYPQAQRITLLMDNRVRTPGRRCAEPATGQAGVRVYAETRQLAEHR